MVVARESSVILVGKCDSCRHSTKSFSENARGGRNKSSNVRNFIILRSGEGLTFCSAVKMTVLTFLVKKSTMKLSRVSFL